MVHNQTEMRHAAKGGAIAGVIAGAALTAMMTLMSLSKGKDVWYGMKGAAAPLLGERAMAPGFDVTAVALGLFDHFAVSLAWGVLFGLVAYGLKKGWTLLAGAAWGIPVWLGMYYVLLPMVGLGTMTTEAPIARVIMFHEIFGVALGAAFLPFQRHVPAHTIVRHSRPSHA